MEKPIASARQRLDESWIFGGISQRVPHALYRHVQTVIEVNKCVCGPKLTLQFLAAHYLTGVLKQNP
jgi:hypothetical protein